MSIPKYDELMKPILEVVSDGNQYTMKSLERLLAQKENLTEAELQEMLPSGRQTVFKNRVAWSKTYLKKAGLIDSPARATVVITEAGQQVLRENPDKIDNKYLERFPAFHSFMSSAEPDSNSATPDLNTSDLTPDDQLEDAF